MYTIYVGDSITDVETIRNLDIKFMAVLTGITRREITGTIIGGYGLANNEGSNKHAAGE